MSIAEMTWREMLKSPWVDYRRNRTDTLLITFSPMGTPEDRFAPYTAVNKLDFSILRFNGPNAQWYIGGIPETDRNFGELEALINALIEEENYRHVIVFGGSKGGFGALEIGLRINSNVIITTGAETLFGIKGGNARPQVSAVRIKRGRARMHSWRAASLERDRRLFFIYGEDVHVDILCACRAAMIFNIEPIILAKCGHSVPQFMLDNNYSIADLICSLDEAGSDDFLERNRSANSLVPFFPEMVKVEAALQLDFEKPRVR